MLSISVAEHVIVKCSLLFSDVAGAGLQLEHRAFLPNSQIQDDVAIDKNSVSVVTSSIPALSLKESIMTHPKLCTLKLKV